MKLGRRNAEVYEFAELATYNSERARGIMHTPEWQRRMYEQQQRFNTQQGLAGAPRIIPLEAK